MKKYMFLGISVFSMAVDMSVSAGYGSCYTDTYSLGVAQGVNLGDLPIALEVGADLHYNVSHDSISSYDYHHRFKSLPRVTMSAHAKALFPFTEFDSIIIGHSLHSSKNSNELTSGQIFGFRRQVSDEQSFQICFESIKANQTNQGVFHYGDTKVTFTVTKSFNQD